MFGAPKLPPGPAVIPWDTKFEIGHELIDSQHRIFLLLLNKLVSAIYQRVPKEHLFRVLNELKKYAEFHFLSEENLMYEVNYPDIKAHEAIHSRILLETALLLERVAQDRANPDDVVTFLKSWLFVHILNEDSRIAQFVEDEVT